MNQIQLNKLLRLVRRTGDRAIIPDHESDDLFIMMDSNSYEGMISHTKSVRGLSEEEMMEKINRDIALWRSHNQSETLDWYDGGDGTYNDCDDSFDKDYSNYDFDGRFNPDYWDKTTKMEIETEEDIINEDEVPFDELERDGFIVENEETINEDVSSEDEPLYFEHNGSESAEEATVPELDIDDEDIGVGNVESTLNTENIITDSSISLNNLNDTNYVSRFEGTINNAEVGLEESLSDVLEDTDEDDDSNQFLVEPGV